MKKVIQKIRKNRKLMDFFRYGVFGVATTVLNIVTYQLLLLFFDYRVSNVIAIIVSKTFAYVTNKFFVFHSRCGNRKELIKEIIRFVLARGATGLLDFFGLIFAVDVMHFSRIWSKYVLQVFIIILNYVLGKKAVFLSDNRNELFEK